jgi:alpha-1,6-mannosyltransferase
MTAVASSLALVVIGPRHSPLSVVLVAVSTGACGFVAVFERRSPCLGIRPIAAAITLVFTVAVVVPPRSSNDLWSYTMYGRAVSVHSESPYERVPADFPSDPFLSRVSPVWRHRASLFGPAFVGFASVGTSLAGDSALANRLFFQLAAAAAAAVVLVILWRRTRSPAALTWLGLHPAFGALAINGGHIDVLIGLGILSAALLAARHRGALAGLVIGVVALMKLTALLALVGVVLWGWRRRDSRLVTRAVVATAACVALGYAAVLNSAVHALHGADRTVTSASVWNPIAEALVGHDAGRGLAHPLAPNPTLTVLFYASFALVGAVAVLVGWRAAQSHRPEPVVGGTTASYTMAANYTYPWYSSWALPVFTNARPSKLGWIVWLQAALMAAAQMWPLHPTGAVPDTIVRAALDYLAPMLLLIAFVVIGLQGKGDADDVPAVDLA